MVASSEKPPGMDWSKRPGGSEICCNPDEFADHSVMNCSRFIVVHGAGSFGLLLFLEVKLFLSD